MIKYSWSEYREGIIVDEYNGEWSICLAQEGRDDKVPYKKWCFPQNKDRKPIAKAVPWKIALGQSKEEALENLRVLADTIRNFPNDEGFEVTGEDDIPW